jgi:DNA-binding winged helix-turn-helix (wHTH) protein/predicted ATPase
MLPGILRFADFELDRNVYELRRKGHPQKLERIPLDLLFLLIEKRGQLVTREEILERLWGKGVFFDVDNAINTAVRKLRRALGDNPEAPRFILTVPARGYRFVAQIRRSKTSSTGRVRARGLDAMVGRERELSSLGSGLAETLAGHGRLVFLVSGEPGIGKTRLADEFAAVAEAKGLAVRIGHCFQEAVPFLPFVEMLERFVDAIAEPEQLRRQLAEEASELARLLPKLRRILPDLPPAMDLPPLQARRHLFNCFFDFVARSASEQPTLMIVEDLHWADDSTLALLDHLAQRIADLPVMLLGTYRDAEIDVTRGLAKTLEDLLRGRIATRLKLKGLRRDDVATMLSRLSGKSAPAGVVEEIFAETEGNPFFVEELFRHLDEENRLYNSAGQFHSSLKIAEFEVPDSVRLVVARRLERLDETTRRMLATAATIGRFFSFELLEAASRTDGDSLMECIAEAEGAGLVYSLTEAPKARFQFSHELVRQAVISRLSGALRQKLHLEVAEAIERIYSINPVSPNAVTLDDYVADLAHHYSRGGNREKAIQYLQLAAQQAVQRSASSVAIDQLTNALRILKSLPETAQRDQQELILQMMLGPLLIATKGNASLEVEQIYLRARELAQQLNAVSQQFPSLFGLRSVYLVRGELLRAHELSQQLVRLAESENDTEHLLEARVALGNTFHLQGALRQGHTQFEKALGIYDQKRHRSHAFVYGIDPGVFCLAKIILTLTALGYVDRTLEKTCALLALAREVSHPLSLVLALQHASEFYLFRREADPANELSESAMRVAEEQGLANFLGQATIFFGATLAQKGQTSEGISRIRQGLAACRATGAVLFRPFFLRFLADAYLRAEQLTEGLAVVDEALSLVSQTQERYPEAELWRLKGELTRQTGLECLEEAENCLRKAIAVARSQEAKFWELRATTSLARLQRDTNRRDEARAMLGKIYNWFTEGFDIADLKDAKALLDELGSDLLQVPAEKSQSKSGSKGNPNQPVRNRGGLR